MEKKLMEKPEGQLLEFTVGANKNRIRIETTEKVIVYVPGYRTLTAGRELFLAGRFKKNPIKYGKGDL